MKLYRSTSFQAQSMQFKWVTAILLYQGLRPSEACQLRVTDIRSEDGVACSPYQKRGSISM
ncbi:hypothetical protein LRP50_20630 [Enterovibrio sp. ZSDZ42]|uniref:Tyr recombinase domain-containing protein n=1 Tax=Enterovibrio gelatinilyticus TaxID=2899819 RepID=A0ABT5R7P5_9GAMM|nr:hypothetical protein [Enterovibrio sp. ZSDZ42]MDD1795537.1 hypothetical protein [Enterovibrio sp. ZSDZ42]